MNGSSTTIVARATSPHPAAISIIRLSGPQSHTIAKFVAGKVTTTRQAELVSLKDKDGKTLDQGLQIIFHAPHSYTGENMVEWHCHGSVLLGNILLETAIAFGAQMAEPGEFTKRAFFNDKMDLHQAQAVAGIIDATSKRQMHLAASSLAGHFSQLLAKLSKQLDWLRSQIEAHLDFSDEHINPANLQKMTAVIANLHEKLSTLVAQANNNLAYAHCPKVLLLGEPNTGKSSIFNCLLGEKRALVSEQAGTTRDLLREHLRCGDINIRLCDSAGIRHSNNTIEQAGVTLTFEQFTEADYVLVVFDANQAMPLQLIQQLQDRLALIPHQLPEQNTINSKRICLVANKVDLLQQQPKLTNYLIAGNSLPCIWLSALHNRGIDLLRQWLEKEIAHEQIPEQGDAFLIGQHHAHALTQAQNDLEAATNLLSEQSLELCAEHLRIARLAIDQLTGRSANDALLDSIFSQFCIGK